MRKVKSFAVTILLAFGVFSALSLKPEEAKAISCFSLVAEVESSLWAYARCQTNFIYNWLGYCDGYWQQAVQTDDYATQIGCYGNPNNV